ncbi:heavy metal translocating P-type ATPase [Staphylococcus xylosus]|jgi:Cd2+/Zn2+-exporting ATPase|uniref:heavy metal translocating P-type ATPase n=1 Tax=Staphylococcus xylosus TaxID=1288 RepID=UPI001CDB59A1|nr:heavy metal translocating P-type ATPase [Staphylococcus xylosus]MCQ3820618.1 heavy metal translocating P-type ATPase [Staphylococcus xylosus]UBV38899.1 heavy metal translocating P-type ATPase [Staphylococcus xylosus]
MLRKYKQHAALINTIICAFLILVGIILNSLDLFTYSIKVYLLAFIIGGLLSAKEGLNELIKDKHFNVDLLMILAAIGASVIGYWMEAALLIFIFSLAETMEKMAEEKTKNTITELLKITPDLARHISTDGTIDIISTQELEIGMFVQVPKGETIPIDGELTSEYAVVNESAITGESISIEKKSKENLIGGTLNEGETFEMQVTKNIDNTLFSKIIRLVDEAQSSPSHTASFIENIESIYVKTILLSVPLFILLTPFILNWSWEQAFYRGMVLLTVASPCALIASATPATLSAISRATRRNMLFKSGNAIDVLNQVKAIIFDKTGTLTIGQPTVQESFYMSNVEQKELKKILKSAENEATHPIAQALVKHLNDVDIIPLDYVNNITGKGLQVYYNNHEWRIGKLEFVTNRVLDLDIQQKINSIPPVTTQVYVSKDNKLEAYFSLSDQIKDDTIDAISKLNKMNIHTIMVTGDNFQTANEIARTIGIKEVYANKLPQEKAEIAKKIKNEYETIAVVGDGINDAPALAIADVGFSMGNGTDISMETSDAILMQNDLIQIPFSISLSLKLKKIVKENIIFSLSIIVILIFTNILQLINLPLGVIGHEGSTILVIINSLRLLYFKDDFKNFS